MKNKNCHFLLRGDWLLKFVYRTSSATMNIAGLQPIQWKDRRMRNLDLSNVVITRFLCFACRVEHHRNGNVERGRLSQQHLPYFNPQISGHMDYYDKIDQILEVIGVGTKSLEASNKRRDRVPRPKRKTSRSCSEPNLRCFVSDFVSCLLVSICFCVSFL